MPDPNSSRIASRGGRATVLWVGAVLLCAAATGVLVLSEDARLLRLGIVAALWAALLGAFAVARLRYRASEDEDRESELKRIYELELEKEIAARREFELEAENEARRRVAEESDGELESLRSELATLRQSLEQILGGDVLFERVALRAESTRVRSLSEREGQRHDHPQDPRVIPSHDGWGRELTTGHLHGGSPRSSAARGHAGQNGSARSPAAKPAPQGGFAEANTDVVPRVSAQPEAESAPSPAEQSRETEGPAAAPHGKSQREHAAKAFTRPAPAGPGNGTARSKASAPRRPKPAGQQQKSAATQQKSAATQQKPAATQQTQAQETPAPAGAGQDAEQNVEATTAATTAESGTTSSRSGTDSSPRQPEKGGQAESSSNSTSSGGTSQVDSGAHAEGTSVNDLLAAYGGGGESPRRHRRRSER
jgi:hypothetical protein